MTISDRTVVAADGRLPRMLPHSPPGGAVVLGRSTPLREELARSLRTCGLLIDVLDEPSQLAGLAASRPGHAPLGGTAVVLVAEPYLPGFATRARVRHRARTLGAANALLARRARDLGADLLVVCSTAFLYGDDQGHVLDPSAPIDPRPETVAALAVERAARRFFELGGRSVVLRLGWTFGPGDPIADQVITAARKGWRLIDGSPASVVPSVSLIDAATAVVAALGVPAGTYDVADASLPLQGQLNAALEVAAGEILHPLYDWAWGPAGTLFGASRRLDPAPFTSMTGWHPTAADLSTYLRNAIREGRN